MDHISGTPREQLSLLPEAVEDYVSEDNPVRVIDAFVESLDLASLGFAKAEVAETGRPPYRPGDLLKLYIYGYLNKVRASRRLERETQRNLEVIWLLRKLAPDHKTISDFRKDNRNVLRSVTRQFVFVCQTLDLYGSELVALDGTKVRASNSRQRNFTKNKLKARIKKIDESIDEYLKELDSADQHETPRAGSDTTTLHEKISTLSKRMKQYQLLLADLEENGHTQVSLTDPDSRLMVGNGKADVGYNLQAVVDSKYKLIVDHEVTNDVNDRYQLLTMAVRAKEVLGVSSLEVTADKGYATATELKACEDQGILPYVPVPEPTEKRKSNIPTIDYYHARFRYEKQHDAYQCPQNHALTFLYKTWHRKHWTFVYGTPACRGCPVRHLCTTNRQGRRIYRSDQEQVFDRLRERNAQNPQKLKIRQCLSEHPFGTIKHAWNQGHFLLRGLEKVKGESSLSILAYNIKRAISIVGVPTLVRSLT